MHKNPKVMAVMLAAAAAGAAVGGMSGAAADGAAKEGAKPKPDPRLAELRQRIGDRNYASALLLAQCKHRDAIASAEETLGATQDPQQRTYPLMIQGIAAEAPADALEGVIKVQAARRDHGFPPTCK